MAPTSNRPASSNAPIDFAAWDKEIESKNADLEKLYQQMLKASKEMQEESAEVWWRLARATFMVTFNYIYEGSGYHDAIKSKCIEACTYAGKAILLEPNHFEANLWMAKSAGKVALVELDTAKKTQWIEAFLRALSVCVLQKPEDPRVLFLEGRLQLAMLTLTDDQKQAIEKNCKLPEPNMAEAEMKLRRFIELIPTAITGYMTLALVLLELDKSKEARQIVDAGLALERNTRSDEYVAQQLEKVKAFLLEHGNEKPNMV